MAMRIRGSVVLATALAVATCVGSQVSQAQISVGVNINVAPPELPVYTPPPLPSPGWIWTPGYWAWADDGSGYYWVPGTWVEPPQAGFLWTPGYWGWEGGAYLWHAGYWGQHVGFYGGVNYGFGYTGAGFVGAEWRGGALFYNTAIVHAGPDVHITNVYNQTVNVTVVNHVSFNGGNGGIQARPTPEQEQFSREQHLPPVAAQRTQETSARGNPALRASANGGHPPVAATARPGEFSGKDVVAARGAPAHPEANAHPANAPHAAVHPQEHAAPHENVAERPAAAEHAAPSQRVNVARGPDQPAAHAAPRPEEHAAPRPEQQHAAPHPEAEHAAPRPEEKRPDEGQR